MTRLERPPASSGAAGTAPMLRALGYLRAHRPEVGFALLSLLAVAVANLYAPQFIRPAVEGGLTKRNWNTILLAVGGLVSVALVRSLFTFLQNYLSERASQRVACAL